MVDIFSNDVKIGVKMKKVNKCLMVVSVVLCAVSLSSCKPSYEVPVNDPIMTTAPADAPYEMDFDQLNDDVIDSFSKTHVIFPYVKSMDISGDNDAKNIKVTIDIHSDVPEEAVQLLLSDVTKKIDNNAYIQDFRIKKADDTQFGSIYDIYSYTYVVTCNGETLYDETIQPGAEIPFDPSVNSDKIMEMLEEQQTDTTESVTEKVETRADNS